MKCPNCGGELEKRRDRDWHPDYVCMGACGGHWSIFDLDILTAKTPQTDGASRMRLVLNGTICGTESDVPRLLEHIRDRLAEAGLRDIAVVLESIADERYIVPPAGASAGGK